MFAFAGIWNRWKDPSGQWVKSCSILTTIPNAVTPVVHGRMPVILDPDSYELWLDPGMTNVAAASALLKPYDAGLMRCFAVSTRVNNVANDDEECSALVEIAETQNHFRSKCPQGCLVPNVGIIFLSATGLMALRSLMPGPSAAPHCASETTKSIGGSW